MITYADYLRRAARRWPERTAVVSPSASVTFAGLLASAEGLATGLRARGLGVGDRVADLRENSVESVVTDFGCALAGVTRVSVNPRSSDEEIAFVLRDSRPSLLLADGASARRAAAAGLDRLVGVVLDELPSATGPRAEAVVVRDEDVLALRYTGGTTGRPKGALRTHGHQLWVATNVLLDLCDLRESDVLLHTQPLSHGAHVFVLPCVMRGTTQVVLPRFDPAEVVRTIAEHGVTVVKCVPTALHRLLDHLDLEPAALGTLRQIIYGAAPIPEVVLTRALDRFGPILSQTYGQTEAPATVSALTVEDHRRAMNGERHLLRSAGRPYSTVDVRIVDGEGRELPAGETGEVCVRGPMTMSRYWERDGSPVDDAGYVRTGDVGYLDAESYLYLVDRSRDVIICGGYNVYPREVEEVLYTHPGVSEVVVVGLPDAEWGDRVVAAVVPRGTPDLTELLRHCRDRLSTYKVPREIRLVESLPKTAAGKQLRREVAEVLRGGRG